MAYEQGLETTVIDYSLDYHQKIGSELHHKNLEETFVHGRWQDMNFLEEFDVIFGDLVIGNMKPAEIPDFLTRIGRSLRPAGVFITKSFFWQDGYKQQPLDDIFTAYREAGSPAPLFSHLIYDIALAAADHDSGILRFRQMYDALARMRHDGAITEREFAPFTNLGWQSDMEFEFYIPRVSEWEQLVKRALRVLDRPRGTDVYANHFSMYVLVRSDSPLLGAGRRH